MLYRQLQTFSLFINAFCASILQHAPAYQTAQGQPNANWAATYVAATANDRNSPGPDQGHNTRVTQSTLPSTLANTLQITHTIKGIQAKQLHYRMAHNVGLKWFSSLNSNVFCVHSSLYSGQLVRQNSTVQHSMELAPTATAAAEPAKSAAETAQHSAVSAPTPAAGQCLLGLQLPQPSTAQHRMHAPKALACKQAAHVCVLQLEVVQALCRRAHCPSLLQHAHTKRRMCMQGSQQPTQACTQKRTNRQQTAAPHSCL